MKDLPPEIDSQLSEAIIETMTEPLIVLDDKLCVLVANRAFYEKFHVEPVEVKNAPFYKLGNGQWDIPDLRHLLELVIPKETQVENYEVTHDFPDLGKRIMVINAREIRYQNGRRKMLLSIQDVTEQRHLMHQKDTLLKEMRHRIANSLQLIASILILKAADV